MPRLGQVDPNSGSEEQKQIGGTNFTYSATRIDKLQASEYTLVSLVVDASGSVGPFAQDLENMVKEVVKSCQRSPRADNLMLRYSLFNHSVSESHGFRPLPNCNMNDYDNSVHPSGTTALYDAVFSAARAMVAYGKDLTDKDFGVNAVLFVLTDGMDNQSVSTPNMVAQAIKEATKGESVESLLSVLIGVGTDADPSIDKYLQAFKTEAGFSQYVSIANANEKTLAKLAGFISRSISSSSVALGSGGPSQALTF